MGEKYKIFRRRVYSIINKSEKGDVAASTFAIFITALILLNVTAFILETVGEIRRPFAFYFDLFEAISVILFTIEYTIRLWSCVDDEKIAPKGVVLGRLAYIFKFMMIIDLLVLLPFYFPLIFPDLRFLRTLRLLRLIRILKLGRYSKSVGIIFSVIKRKRGELVASLVVVFIIIILSSCVLFFIENPVQPNAFSSIPATMWWSVITLTTVGYGDIAPVTLFGKFIAAFIAILGIGLVGIPAGIMASGFSELYSEDSIQDTDENNIFKESNGDPLQCPHCGEAIKVNFNR